MAQLASILSPESVKPNIQTVASLGTSTAIYIGNNKKFYVSAYDANLVAIPFHVAYGGASVTADATNAIFLPGQYTLASRPERGWDYIAIYNPNSVSIKTSVGWLSNS